MFFAGNLNSSAAVWKARAQARNNAAEQRFVASL
jgi:hypothetical protein